MCAARNGGEGEVAGSFLLGLVASFGYINIVPEDLYLDDVDPARWYPYSRLITAIEAIRKAVPHSDIILFRAGANFMRIWYENGPGKAMIKSGIEWLYANSSSGGYNSVVRGPGKNEIGWCLLRSIDEQAGIAVYENVMPLPADFVKGVFYGGCMIFNDMECVEIDSVTEPYEANAVFNKFILTVRYKLRSEIASKTLDAKLERLRSHDVSLTPDEVEMLMWRTKGMEVKLALETTYHQAIGELLAINIDNARKTARRLAERNVEIEYLANYDVLTGLPNRRMALDRLGKIRSDSVETPSNVSILYVDLDGFKVCNDRFGHGAGDYVLRTVAERISKCLRQDDMAARMGGDEFLVIVSGVTKTSLVGIARKIIDTVSQPFYYNSHKIKIGSSMGIAIADDPVSPDLLLKQADQAMYMVKHWGKNNFAFFGDDARTEDARLAQAPAA